MRLFALVGLEFELGDLLERLAAPYVNQRLNGLLIETVAHGLECGPFALLVGSLSGYAGFLKEFNSGVEEACRSLELALFSGRQEISVAAAAVMIRF